MNWLSKFLKIGATSITAAALLIATTQGAQAVTFTESGDAGQTLATAAVITPGSATGIPGTPLTSISGAITSGNADLFQFLITGSTFSASTIGGSTFDTQLFLFNSSGLGIFTNDDSGGGLQSAFTVTGLTAGIYYLGISGFNYDPLTGTGAVVFPTANPVSPGTALAGTGVLSSWGTATTSSLGSYTIALTGAAPVPEPSSVLGLIALGGLGGGVFLKRRKKITTT